MNWNSFYTLYAQDLRGSLFSGFLALSGFLVCMSTFVVVNMKKELYDQKEYQSRVNNLMGLEQSMTIYGPLRRLSQLLLWAVVSSVVASVSQLTVGFIPHAAASILCVCLALAAITILSVTLYAIRTNLVSLFDFLESQACRRGAGHERA
jgi:hypothetical protein